MSEAEEEVAKMQAAIAEKDTVALDAAIKRAVAAGSDAQEVAAAKRALFQLQKEKRAEAKKAKEVNEVAKALADAASFDDVEVLRGALVTAKGVGLDEAALAEAEERLKSLEDNAKKDKIRCALDDAEYAISQEDIEAASYALEDATAEGAEPDDLEPLEKALAELRLKNDPEGEARRRRLEARKAKDQAGGKKWNFSGKCNNPQVNDRFREHEEELEKRRMLAFRGRGKFRGDAADEGDEGQDREVRKQRAERNKEEGYVPPPPRAVPKQGFQYLPPSKEETEAPRKLTLQQHVEMGAGIDLHATWWGMVVDGIDEQPGQVGLRLQDTIVDVNGTGLRELDDEDCEQRFADLFGDGSVVTVVPHVEVVGVLHSETAVDRDSLKKDLTLFASEWVVDLRFEEISTGGTSLRIVLEGPQPACRDAKPELENLMKFYSGGG